MKAAILSEGCRMLNLARGSGAARVPLKQLADGVCSLSYMGQLADGTRTPSLETAVRLRRKFGIPCEAWLERAVLLVAETEGEREADGGRTDSESKPQSAAE